MKIKNINNKFTKNKLNSVRVFEGIGFKLQFELAFPINHHVQNILIIGKLYNENPLAIRTRA